MGSTRVDGGILGTANTGGMAGTPAGVEYVCDHGAKMDRQAINSANIASAGYDEESQIMEVEFDQGGAIYQYHNVPKSVWEAFLNGNTPGQYHYHFIRSTYLYVRVG